MMTNSTGRTILIVTWILGSIASLSFGARLYARFILLRQHGWDDYTMIVSWLLAMVSAILDSVAVHYGLGMNIDDIKDPLDQMHAVKYLTIAPIFSILSVGLGKVSVILLILRLMGLTATRVHFWLLWMITFISLSLNVATVIVVLRFCIPTEANLDKTVQGTCVDPHIQLGVGLGQASFNAFTDLFLALFPTWVLWSLKLPPWRKVGLMALMGAGVFGAVITSYKAYQLRNLSGHNNVTVSWAPITIWNTVEMFVLIVTANVPTLKPLFRSVLGLQSYGPGSYCLKSSSNNNSSERRYNSRGYVDICGGVANTSVDPILPTGNENGSSGIVKATDFTVSYGPSP